MSIDTIIGVIFAFLTSIAITGYAIPKRFSKQHISIYTMYFCFTTFVTCCIFVLITLINPENLWYINGKEKHNLVWTNWQWLTVLRGVIFCSSLICYNYAIDYLGLARSNQWKNLKTPIGAILMIIVLNDIGGYKIALVFGALVLLFCAAVCFEIKNKTIINNKKQMKIGIIFGLLTATLTGVNDLIQKTMSNKGYVNSQMFYWILTLFLCSLAYCLFVNRKQLKTILPTNKQFILPVIGGFIFFFPVILNLIAYAHIPGTIASSITQLCTLWTLLVSVLVFKEYNVKKSWIRLSIGLLLVICAMVLIYFSM